MPPHGIRPRVEVFRGFLAEGCFAVLAGFLLEHPDIIIRGTGKFEHSEKKKKNLCHESCNVTNAMGTPQLCAFLKCEIKCDGMRQL